MARTRFLNFWEKSRFSDAQYRFNRISFPAFVRAWFLTFGDLRATSWLLSKAALAGAFQSHRKLSKSCKCIPRQTWIVQSNPTLSRIVQNSSKQLRAFELLWTTEELWKYSWISIGCESASNCQKRCIQGNPTQSRRIRYLHAIYSAPAFKLETSQTMENSRSL